MSESDNFYMDAEKVIKILLQDENIPKPIFNKIFSNVIHSWDKRDISQLQGKLINLIAENRSEYLFLGPRLLSQSKKIEVAQIISIDSFLKNYFRKINRQSVIYDFNDLDFMRAHLKYILQGSTEIYSSFANWVTLESEIVGLDTNDVIAGLGQRVLLDRTFVKLSYQIDSDLLRVPTAIDALFFNDFVPKPIDRIEIPKAWNWQKNTWGLPEFVHPNFVLNSDEILITDLGTAAFTKFSPFVEYEFYNSLELENIIKEIIIQIGAHHTLLEFVTSEKDFMTLSPIEFEKFVAQLYQRRGLEAFVTQQTHDGGFDVIVLKNNYNNEGLLIQVKKTEKVVGIKLIRELAGSKLFSEYNTPAYMLVFVTTNFFSREARREENKQMGKLKLIDYLELQKIISTLKNIGTNDILQKASSYREKYEK